MSSVTPHALVLSIDEYTGGLEQPAHVHDHLHLSLILRGHLEETIGDVVEQAGALSVVVKDPGVRHADRFGPAPVLIARLSLAGAGLGALVEPGRWNAGWRWAHERAVARAFVQLVARYTGATAQTSPRGLQLSAGDETLLDLLAALTARPLQTRAATGAPPRWLADAIARWRAEWTPQLTVRALAAETGVHPVYLARCVRRWYGHGVHDELQRLRLRAAANQLAQLDGTVSQVAHATGWSDEAHLCRAFRAQLGVTPTRFRVLARQPPRANVVAFVQGAKIGSTQRPEFAHASSPPESLCLPLPPAPAAPRRPRVFPKRFD